LLQRKFHLEDQNNSNQFYLVCSMWSDIVTHVTSGN